jgi:hypothetical protein
VAQLLEHGLNPPQTPIETPARATEQVPAPENQPLAQN